MKIPTADHLDRVARVRDQLDNLEADAILVTGVGNVRYLTGFTGDSSYLLIRSADAVILSDGRYQEQLSQQCPDFAAVIRPPSQKTAELVSEVTSGPGSQRVAIESQHMTVSALNEMKGRCESIDWVETVGVVEQLRLIKDELEISLIREAIELAERAFTKTINSITPETSERDFALDLEIAMRRDSADGPSFDIIAGFGETGALPHYHPADRPLGDSPTILIDWGANYHGYASDMTRTLHRNHASDQFKRAYEAVLEAQLAAIEAIRPGVECADVDRIARETLKKHGLADAFLHSLGHGIGLNVHEGPRLAEMSTETLREGMVITIEPGVYFANDFGIRIEDDVWVTASGSKVLTSLPKGLDDCRLMM